MTDHGLTFTSEVFKELMEKTGICHLCYAPSCCNQRLSRKSFRNSDRWTVKNVRVLSGYKLIPVPVALHDYSPHKYRKASNGRCYPEGGQDLLHPNVRARVIRSQDDKRRTGLYVKETVSPRGRCTLIFLPQVLLVARLNVVG